VPPESDDPRLNERAGPPPASLGGILDSISEGVFSVDDQGRITSLNRAAEQLLGISRSEALGRPCSEIFRSDLCQEACPLRYTRETGLSIRNHPVRFTDARGRRIPVSVSTNLLRDGRGAIVGAVESFRDLRVEEALRKEIRDKYTSGHRLQERMRQLFGCFHHRRSDATVLIEGGTGTGKELLAGPSTLSASGEIAARDRQLRRRAGHAPGIEASATRPAPSPAPGTTSRAGSRGPTAARSFWTRWARCRPLFR
jgi:PAS domain S-box-containing protein